MSGIGEINPNVPSTAQIPDTYLYISTTPTSIGTNQPKDLFLVATGILSGSAITGSPYSLTAGTATPNEIKQYSDVSRVNRAFNRRAPISNRFRSALQEVPIGINIFLAAIAEPTNSGFAGFATKVFTFSGTASGSGEIKLQLAGHTSFIPVANGDVASSIADSAKSAVDSSMLDAPLITGSVIDLSLPVITITVNATGSNFGITANGISKSITITAGWTPTQSATAIAGALAGDTAFPLTATSNVGVVTLAWRTGFPVSSLSISGVDATQQYALSYLTTGSSAGATLPVIYVVRGADGNDSAALIDIPPEITGISISPAIITVSTTSIGASSAASLFALKCDATDYVVSIPVGTTAAQAATLIAAAITATTGPLYATASGAIVTLFMRSGWFVKKLQVSSTEDATGQTYRLADRHDSAGAVTSVTTTAGNPALTGLSGAGAPTLTTLLSNKAKLRGFSEWSCDYLDATSISAISRHMEEYGNGYYQQNQRVTYVSTDPLEAAALIAPSATPQLGNYWRPSIGICQGGACQGGAYATQTAARLCATALPFNMDNQVLTSGTLAPMEPGRSETELSPTSMDVALGSYYLFVLRGDNGAVRVVRGKTCWAQSNKEWGDWSYGRIFDAIRFGLRAFLNTRFNGKVLFVGGGTIRVPNAFTIQDVKDAIAEYLDSQDGILVDGAKDLKQFIDAEPDPSDKGFIRLFLRERPPRENHIRTGVIAAQQ